MSDGGGSRLAGDHDFVVVHVPDDAGWAAWIAWQIERRLRFADGRAATTLVRARDDVPGSVWAAVKDRALRGTARVVPVLSRAFLEAPEDHDVWQARLAQDPAGASRMIVPVRVDDCTPSGQLGSRTFIDLVGLLEAEASEALAAGITAAVRGPAKPTVAPTFPGGMTKPVFPGPPQPPPDRSGRTRSAPPIRSTVTVLHLPELRIGTNAGRDGGTDATRRGSSGHGSADGAVGLHALLDDLDRLATSGDLRPDLVVITGNLTETGDEDEFDQAHDLLVDMVERLGLDRDRVIVVPGDRDVNRPLCKLHFFEATVRKRAPVPPYWPKWEHYDGLLRRFYGDMAPVGFQIGEEWSLFQITAIPIVVAGLNSTIVATHEVGHGWLGEPQLHAVSDALRQREADGWLRLGVVHHAPLAYGGGHPDPPSDRDLHDSDDLDRSLGPTLNLLLHGQPDRPGQAARLSSGTPILAAPGIATPVLATLGIATPNAYQLLRIDRDGWTRYARWYDPSSRGWRSDLGATPTAARPGGDAVRIRHRFTAVEATFPAPPPAPPPTPVEIASAPTNHDDHPQLGDYPDPDPGDRGDRGSGLETTARVASERGCTDGELSRPRDVLDELTEITQLRFPDATITRVVGLGELPAHLRVQRTEARVVERRIVGFIDGEVDEAAVEDFDRAVRRPYLAKFPNLYAVLVYGGARQAEPAVARLAVRRDVELVSLAEYQGVLDLRGYLERQRSVLVADPDYPPELYVPQRIRRMDRSARTMHEDALAQVTDWLTTDEARFVLMLGSFGHGKTFFMHMLALGLRDHLPHVTPMLIKLRELEKSPDLDRLVAQHLVDRGERRPDLYAFDYMRRQGRLVLLFDGFDELVVRVTYERAVAYLDTLLNAVDGRAKVVVTSRREFFLTDDEILKRTGDKVERTLGRFIVHVDDFTPEQVKLFLFRYYLTRLLPDHPGVEARHAEAARRADARLELITHVADLPDLARNPRLLSFIAELDDDRLRAARRRAAAGSAKGSTHPPDLTEDPDGGTVTAADLYHELIEQWLTHETERSPDMDLAERRAAVTELAVTMWRAGDSYIDIVGLTSVAQRVLSSMHDQRGLTAAQTAHLLGSGTALRRDTEGRFSFIHQSVMEYLVADDAATKLNRLREERHRYAQIGILSARRMSELVADFFAELCGHERAAQWAQAVVRDDATSPAAKANAVLLANRRGFALRTGANLAGAELAGEDLSHRRDLRGADLRGADLTDARLVGADLSNADLRKATMSGIRIDGAGLAGANLTGATLRSATISGTNLSSADLTGADLAGAVLTDVNLAGAMIVDSRWARAAVRGGLLTVADGAATLADASVAGRDPAEAVVRSTSSSVLAVAFSPDGSLLATGSDGGSVGCGTRPPANSCGPCPATPAGCDRWRSPRTAHG